MRNVESRKQYWTPVGQLRAAVIACHAARHSEDQIAQELGVHISFVNEVLAQI